MASPALTIDEKFNVAVGVIPRLKLVFGVDELPCEKLELDALNKQATVGDAPKERPELNANAGIEWDSWDAKRGMSSDEAKKAYVEEVEGRNKIVDGQ